MYPSHVSLAGYGHGQIVGKLEGPNVSLMRDVPASSIVLWLPGGLGIPASASSEAGPSRWSVSFDRMLVAAVIQLGLDLGMIPRDSNLLQVTVAVDDIVQGATRLSYSDARSGSRNGNGHRGR
jgi:hypothetical protein